MLSRPSLSLCSPILSTLQTSPRCSAVPVTEGCYDTHSHKVQPASCGRKRSCTRRTMIAPFLLPPRNHTSIIVGHAHVEDARRAQALGGNPALGDVGDRESPRPRRQPRHASPAGPRRLRCWRGRALSLRCRRPGLFPKFYSKLDPLQRFVFLKTLIKI